MTFILAYSVCCLIAPAAAGEAPPDSDSDGISDLEDQCPYTPGHAVSPFGRGCPLGQDADGNWCGQFEVERGGVCVPIDETTATGTRPPDPNALEGFCHNPGNWNHPQCGGSIPGGSGGSGMPTPTPQENAANMAECIVDHLSTQDQAQATPHSVETLPRPRVGGRDVDGYAGCVRGSRYITYVKESVAERGGTSLRQLMAHEIAHHVATDLETCGSYDGREHGSRFESALGKV